MEMKYENGRFKELKIDLNKAPEELRNELKGAKTDEERNKRVSEFYGVKANVARSGSIITIDAKDMSRTNINRLISVSLKISPEFSKRSAALATRVLKTRSNSNFNPVTRKKEDAKSTLAERYKSFQEERRAKLSSGSNPDLPDGPGKGIFTKIASKITTSVAQIAAESGTLVAIPIAVAQLYCLVRDQADTIAQIQTLNKVMPMMASANEVISVGSKVQAGDDVDLETIGLLSKSFNSEGSSWSEASTVKYMTNPNSTGTESGPTTKTFDEYPELDPSNKSVIQSGDDFIKTADDYINLANTPTSGVGIAITTYNALPFENVKATDITCSVLDLPGSLAFKAIDWIGRNGPGAPLYEAFSAKAEEWGQKAINWIAGTSIDLTEEKYAGAPYMEAASLGARMMANESAMTTGGSVLSDAQELALMEETNKYLAQNDTRSSLAKAFDPYDYKNPLSKLAASLGSSTIIESFGVIRNEMSAQFASLFTSQTYAAAAAPSDVFYGVPKVGYDPRQLNKDAYEDPFDNAKIVYDALSKDENKKKYFEDCTGVDITEDFDFVTRAYESEDNPVALYMMNDYKEECKNMQTDEILYRTSVLALDTQVLKSFACMELDDEEACQDINGDSSTSSTSTSTTGVTGWSWPFKESDNPRSGPCYGGPRVHGGLDINFTSNIEALAAHTGKVVQVTPNSGAAGNFVMVRVSDDLYYNYQHLKSINVKEGDEVIGGSTVIGLVGLTGSVDVGSQTKGHLHFVISTSTNFGSYGEPADSKDPLDYLPKNSPGGYVCTKS